MERLLCFEIYFLRKGLQEQDALPCHISIWLIRCFRIGYIVLCLWEFRNVDVLILDLHKIAIYQLHTIRTDSFM